MADAVEAVVLPAVHAHGLALIDLDVRGEGGRRLALRVYVDKPGGVGIEDCRRLSEEIGDLVDVSSLVTQPYDLEVSSPGLDRELRKEREFRWAVGKRVRVWTRELLEGRREFVGHLADVGESHLTLTEASASCQVPRALVTKARLDMEPRPPARAGRSR